MRDVGATSSPARLRPLFVPADSGEVGLDGGDTGVGDVYRLQDPADRERLVRRMQEEDDRKHGRIPDPTWEGDYEWVREKIEDARARGLFRTEVDFRYLKSRLLVVEAAVAPRFAMEDATFVQYKIFPDCGVHPEWVVSSLVCRTRVLLLSLLDHEIVSYLLEGTSGFPAPEKLARSLRFASLFSSRDEWWEFLTGLVHQHHPQVSSPETIRTRGRPLLQPSLFAAPLPDPGAQARTFVTSRHTPEAERLLPVLSGDLRLVTLQSRRAAPGHHAYLLMPQCVYGASEPVDVVDWDLIVDPEQVW